MLIPTKFPLSPFACVFVDCLFSIVFKSIQEALSSILFML